MADGTRSDPRADPWLEHCLALPGAWRDEPWDGQVVAKVGPKIFAFLSGLQPAVLGAPRAIGLKCGDREAADLWLERYPGSVTVLPYIGRWGWNAFTLDGSVPDDDVAELVERSYEIVVASLPRRLRPPGTA
ncbi:Predicted DNA-binding protein, MmcQ/YjbR family [Microlunatus sagamiharensis]|uniref:Predicted DNA-binding protein, MmcQ/YjbR family n=1 Tax=Microlunatus sagamiharensis TaxID=546874 RepID=A0A1H2M4F7_9ACTN|nr:MmcQ/YjbR family DNA-binding protein [Microlunatus sagamiharensis]SDU87386.1 Predicted DNA-binding protein, MmcQ/YjbR family [Microlunatus sagamiharensis]